MRAGLAQATTAHLPAWADALTPHAMRHYCASRLYLSGLDLISIQELLGHSWIAPLEVCPVGVQLTAEHRDQAGRRHRLACIREVASEPRGQAGVHLAGQWQLRRGLDAGLVGERMRQPRNRQQFGPFP